MSAPHEKYACKTTRKIPRRIRGRGIFALLALSDFCRKYYTKILESLRKGLAGILLVGCFGWFVICSHS